MPIQIDWNKYVHELRHRKSWNNVATTSPTVRQYIMSLATLQSYLFSVRLPQHWTCLQTLPRTSKDILDLVKKTSHLRVTYLRVQHQEMLRNWCKILEWTLLALLKSADLDMKKLLTLDPKLKSADSLKVRAWAEIYPLIDVLSKQLPEPPVAALNNLASNTLAKKPANTMMAGEKLLCDFCQSSSERNRFGEQEDLLICKDCGNKAHPSCLSYSTDLVEQIRSDGSWQCIDCKACIICQGTGDADTLLFCDACDKGYHMQCHEPKLLQMPSGKWACGECQSKGKSVTTPVTAVAGDNSAPATAQPPPEKMKKKEVFFIADDDDDATKTNEANNKRAAPTHPTVPTKPSAVQQSPHPVIASVVSHAPKMAATATSRRLRVGEVKNVNLNGKSQQQQQQPQFVLGKGVHNNLNHIINPKLPLPDVRSSIREDVLRALPPDVADWTIDDVNYYFKSHGYVEESDLLKQQEMDGRALLLMTRRDCLTGMRIKLGPALKIYHMHIHKLQARTDFLC